MATTKINSFTDLLVWKEGHEVVIIIYRLVQKFPRTSYSLVDQMTRCAVSITSNIAE